MKRTTIATFVLLLSLVAAACSGGDAPVSASTCEDIVGETVELFQKLIDDVDAEFESMSIEDFVATGGDLPSLNAFKEDAEEIDRLGAELNCSQTEVAAGVSARVGELTATTDLGRFLIDSIIAGGL